MIYDIYLYKFNNYYNRILKRHETIEEYNNDNSVITCAVQLGVHFNPNDGISAEQVFDYADGETTGVMPDYMVAIDSITKDIKSRWYVMEAKRVRAEQYHASLYRDVIAEYWNEIVQAPCYVEKGFVTRDDPAIFNAENFEVNQIKQSQTPIKDKLGWQWVVGYLARAVDKTLSIPVESTYGNVYISETIAGIENWEYYSELNAWKEESMPYAKIGYSWNLPSAYYDEQAIALTMQINNNSLSRITFDYPRFSEIVSEGDGYKTGTPTNAALASVTTNAYIEPELLSRQVSETATATQILDAYNIIKDQFVDTIPIDFYTNRYIKDSVTNKIYRVIKTTRNTNQYTNLYGGNATIIGKLNALFAKTYDFGDGRTAQFGEMPVLQSGNNIIIFININQAQYTLEEIIPEYSFDIGMQTAGGQPTGRVICEDSPYDMFCMPYSDNAAVITEGGAQINPDKDLTLSIATAISAAAGSGEYLYDIQLLPYCPVPTLIGDTGNVIRTDEWPTTYVKKMGTENRIAAIIWCKQSSLSFYQESTSYVYPQTPLEFKVANQCDMYRLVSPNDGSIFEFTPTKNRGLTGFNITLTYKPFQPYIHVAPVFGGLYGKTFDYDKRGLILRGDFSLPQATSAWAQFKSQNANYQDIFNREITNIEVMNDIESKQAGWQSLAGIGSGAAAGAVMGSIIPGVGTIVGAAAGGILSAAGGIGDMLMLSRRQEENLDYKRDLYNANLQTIKAKPNTLTKVSAFDIDCAPFPMLEYYTCTETEKEALRNKIRYNGMSVYRIGKLADFINYNEMTYVKGKIIRLEAIGEEFHLINTIAEEVNKGVFVR